MQASVALWIIGLVLLAGGAVGLGLKAGGIEIPVITSVHARVLLAIIGVPGIVLGFIDFIYQQPVTQGNSASTTESAVPEPIAPSLSGAPKVGPNLSKPFEGTTLCSGVAFVANLSGHFMTARYLPSTMKMAIYLTMRLAISKLTQDYSLY